MGEKLLWFQILGVAALILQTLGQYLFIPEEFVSWECCWCEIPPVMLAQEEPVGHCAPAGTRAVFAHCI